MDDKKTVYAFPIHFGDRCHIGDEVLRRQYNMLHSDRLAAASAVTEVTVTDIPVTRCNEQRCSYWTTFNSPPDKPAGTVDEKNEKSEHGGGPRVGPADAMGPLNIMAAIIPFECTWPAADVDHLSSGWKSSSESSIEIRFDDDEEMGEKE